MPKCTSWLVKAIALVAIALTTQTAGAADSDESSTKVAKTAKESPWLLSPTVSADPKLGTTLGAVAGYIKALDPESTPSLVTSFVTYSDTDSYVGGLFGDLYYDGDKHRVKTGYINGKIRNEYDDFLGTGIRFKTEDNIESFFFRYLHRLRGDWYLGGQLIVSNYLIGADGIFEPIL